MKLKILKAVPMQYMHKLVHVLMDELHSNDSSKIAQQQYILISRSFDNFKLDTFKVPAHRLFFFNFVS